MIHKKHRLMIQRLVRVAGEEFEKLAEEICRDTATIAISTATEYIMLLRREVILRVVDAKTAIREGRVEEAVEKLDELLTLLDL